MDEKFFEGVVAGVLPPPDPSLQGSLQVRDVLDREIIPVPGVKAFLYPGATVPSRDDLLDIYNLTNIKEASAVIDLQRLEVLPGSCFVVAGAFAGILKPGRMSMFGTLLIMWGLAKDGILRKSANLDSSRSVSVYPRWGLR